MPSVRYYNQTAPFWDWVAGFENQATRAAEAGHECGNPEDNQFNPFAPEANQFNPFAPRGWMGGFPPGMSFPYRGRHPHPPPPFPDHEPAPEAGPSTASHQDAPNTEEQSPEEDSTPDAPHDRRRSRHGPRGGHHHHHPRPHSPHSRRGGPWGLRGGHHSHHHGRGAFTFSPANPGFNNIINDFLTSFVPPTNPTANNNNNNAASKDFVPDVDVFDTPDAFIIHASLPGAKKDDINVTWDAEKSELGIAGVVTRPGDEEFLKTLALDERQVGVFERKVRLGSRAHPAQVDADGIAAKVEEGILRVSVPKLDAGYVEIKTVDVE